MKYQLNICFTSKVRERLLRISIFFRSSRGLTLPKIIEPELNLKLILYFLEKKTIHKISDINAHCPFCPRPRVKTLWDRKFKILVERSLVYLIMN